jgi:hypothetical protein
MNWNDQKTRVRRFLRDPDGNIWSDTLILHLFNDAQRTIQDRTKLLEDVEAIRVPPMFNVGYLYDWEWRHFNSKVGKNYQALRYHQSGDIVFCYRFEAGMVSGVQDTTDDEGSHFTQPWEGFVTGVTPGDPIPVWFPLNFDSAICVAWDRRPLEYIDRKQLMNDDSTWITHSGHDAYYYRYNDIDNCFILTPLPSSPVWDDLDLVTTADYSFGYSYTWEIEVTSVAALGEGIKFTLYHIDETTDYVHLWEKEHLDGGECLGSDQVSTKATSWNELGDLTSIYGIISSVSGDTAIGDEVGGLVERSATVFGGSYFGVATDVIDDEDNVLLIYKSEPTALENDTDESEFPAFLQKYIEHETLARCYTVDNDGKIDSLRDYWTYRADLGIKLIKKYMELRKVDRDYRLMTPGMPGRIYNRHPRLPDAYPAI